MLPTVNTPQTYLPIGLKKILPTTLNAAAHSTSTVAQATLSQVTLPKTTPSPLFSTFKPWSQWSPNAKIFALISIVYTIAVASFVLINKWRAAKKTPPIFHSPPNPPFPTNEASEAYILKSYSKLNLLTSNEKAIFHSIEWFLALPQNKKLTRHTLTTYQETLKQQLKENSKEALLHGIRIALFSTNNKFPFSFNAPNDSWGCERKRNELLQSIKNDLSQNEAELFTRMNLGLINPRDKEWLSLPKEINQDKVKRKVFLAQLQAQRILSLLGDEKELFSTLQQNLKLSPHSIPSDSDEGEDNLSSSPLSPHTKNNIPTFPLANWDISLIDINSNYLDSYKTHQQNIDDLKEAISKNYSVKNKITQKSQLSTSTVANNLVKGADFCLQQNLMTTDNLNATSCEERDYQLLGRMAIWQNPPQEIQTIKFSIEAFTPKLAKFIERRLATQGEHKSSHFNWSKEDEALWELMCDPNERKKHVSLRLVHCLITAISGDATFFARRFSDHSSETWVCQQPEKTFYHEDEADNWKDNYKVHGDQEIALSAWLRLPSNFHGVTPPPYYTKEYWFDPVIGKLETVENINLWEHVFNNVEGDQAPQ